MFQRKLERILEQRLATRPVTMLIGPRQAGKSTLATLAAQDGGEFVSFDEHARIAEARSDLDHFLSNFSEPVVLDEVQRVPELFLSIKRAVDRDRRPGRFLLTGSANALLLPQVSDSLAGRMAVLRLYPLAQCEIEGTDGQLVDDLFAGLVPKPAGVTIERHDLVERICTGGFPEVVQLAKRVERITWFRDYIETILQRDISQLSHIEMLQEIPKLYTVLAGTAGSLLNASWIASNLDISYSSLKRYLSLLETTFQIVLVPAFRENLAKRTVKSPKIYLIDTGLLAFLSNLDSEALAQRGTDLGKLLENFVALELMKLISWSETEPTLAHFRTDTGTEVDFVLERRDRQIIGVEVKTKATPQQRDFRGLMLMRDTLGDRFINGFVLHTGEETYSFGDRLHAIPLSSLWR